MRFLKDGVFFLPLRTPNLQTGSRWHYPIQNQNHGGIQYGEKNYAGRGLSAQCEVFLKEETVRVLLWLEKNSGPYQEHVVSEGIRSVECDQWRRIYNKQVKIKKAWLRGVSACG
jgi:hypothetical protein